MCATSALYPSCAVAINLVGQLFRLGIAVGTAVSRELRVMAKASTAQARI
jgi:hypothetical protein